MLGPLLGILQPADAAEKRVYILHSYEIDHVCGRPQDLGVQRAVTEAGFGPSAVEYRTYAMDTKRTNTTPELIEQQARNALADIRAYDPDVVVTLDDNAFRTVALKLVDLGPPIVFSGMNTIPENYNDIARWLESRDAPGHNITGVYEKIHFSTAVKVQKNIQPGLKKIRVISDHSPTGVALVRQVRLEMLEEPIPAEAEFHVTDSWEDYQDYILDSNGSDADVLYPIALRLVDRQGHTYTGSEILRWTSQHSVKPSIPLNFAFVKLGLLGGAGVDFEHMGYQAGQMVVRILKGEAPGSIPIAEAERYALVFNLKRAAELGIEIPSDILMSADEVYQD